MSGETRNAEILPEHASHPGWAADGCPARITVTSRSRHGFACAANGEHCLPGTACDSLRQHHAEVQATLTPENSNEH